MPKKKWVGRALGLGAVVALLGAVGYVATSEGHMDQLLKVGAEAPDFEARTAEGGTQRLSNVRGKWAVVYFYPKDDTPGCTKQACAFRDVFDRYAERDIVVFGISRDDEASHARFRRKYHLPFPLVADASGAVQQAYGVPTRLNMAKRVTFLVDPRGRIARVWPEVDPGVDADEVFETVRAHEAPRGG